MADEFNNEDSLKQTSNSEPDSLIKDEETSSFGSVHFAERQIPEDIQQAAQQAMMEQEGIESRHNFAATEKKAAVNSAAEGKSPSIKLENIRFSETLSKAKKRIDSEGSHLAMSEPEKSENEPKDSHSSHNILEASDYSFKDEILSRLREEAEGYEPINHEKQSEMAHSSEKANVNQDISEVSESAADEFTSEATVVVNSEFENKSLAYTETSENNLKNLSDLNLSMADSTDFEDQDPLTDDDPDATRRFDLNPSGTKKLAMVEPEAPVLSRSERNQKSVHRNERLSQDKKKSSRIGRSIVIILIVIIIIAGAFGYFYVKGSIDAVNPQNTKQQVINVPDSTSSEGVAQILEKNHLIKNATVFSYYTKIKGISHFKSGYYDFSQSQTAEQIAKELNKGGSAVPPAIGKITIPEGYTINQMATAFTVDAASKKEAKTPFTKEDFLKVVKDKAFIQKMTKKYPKLFANLPSANSGVKYQLEGYLFPATYEYSAKTTAEELVEEMIAATNKNLTPVYPKLASLDLNVNQLLSLAAIVEKEANTDADRKDVADVFLKRLNIGQPLQTNVTLLYAEGKLGKAVSVEDDKNVNTSLNSPFNLYVNQGVGPGPVDSPSLMSINAVINHTDNDYYYFIADPKTGKVYFAETEAEQEQNVNQYINGQ